MADLGRRVSGYGCIYFTGGATAVLRGWRAMTIDIDIKPDPEPSGTFEAIAIIKNELDVNIELASPDQFIPTLPGWRERSLFIARHGQIEFFHYDPYSQALAKLQRRHERDVHDVHSMVNDGLIVRSRLFELFDSMKSQLIRYPSIDPASFEESVRKFCNER
ncbi:MAG: hypothetical protein HY961_14355 [Ignavibacteriae bacterium]|nr:hypothetical protein [Ignavibacteriota bacterium]